MKILLISANTVTTPYPVYPLGLDYVAGAIPPNHDVRLADMNHIAYPNGLAELLKDFEPGLVGVSLRNIDNTDTCDPKGFLGQYRELVETVREHSDAVIVLGGSGFTIFPSETMKILKADYGIIGEGERLAFLVDALENGGDVSGIPGIVTPGIPDKPPVPLGRSFVRRFDPNNPHLSYYLKKGGMLNLQSKRGCAYKCVYCTYPYIEGGKPRLIPPEEVAKIARDLQNAGGKYLFVTDSVFNSDYAHSAAVAKAFVKAGVSIPWGAFFAPTRPPADYFLILAEAGLTHAEFGTESLSDRVLSAYGKPFRSEQVLKTHWIALDAGLNVAHFFLLGGPGESLDTLNETFSNIDKLNKTVLFFFCGMRIYPHTALYEIALKEGQISDSDSIVTPVFYRSKFVSREEIIDWVQKRAAGRSNWITGSGGEDTANILARMYDRGHTGPLWEFLAK